MKNDRALAGAMMALVATGGMGCPDVFTIRAEPAVYAAHDRRRRSRPTPNAKESPAARVFPKVAGNKRNQPCACGSGKKFKRCCALLPLGHWPKP